MNKEEIKNTVDTLAASVFNSACKDISREQAAKIVADFMNQTLVDCIGGLPEEQRKSFLSCLNESTAYWNNR